jgi:hypothetical protein
MRPADALVSPGIDLAGRESFAAHMAGNVAGTDED